MVRDILVETLYRNRSMRSMKEVANFESALAGLPRQTDRGDLADLFTIFIDDCQHEDVMWGLLHLIESAGCERLVAAILVASPNLAKQAPGWAETIHARILNDHLYLRRYKDEFAKGSPEMRSAAKSILLKLQANEPRFTEMVREVLGEDPGGRRECPT